MSTIRITSEGFSKINDHLKKITENNKEIINNLQKNLSHPELTLAVVGTTSSGKSTLVNMLIDADLMPKEVQEMSAGVVKVIHSNDERSLTIPQTEGATWTTGTWTNLSAQEIRQKLDDTMKAFRQEEEKYLEQGKKLEAVRFEVKWPTYIGKHADKFGLPSTVQFSLLDLPGLKAMNDESNGSVIQKNIQKALCLVVYNSAETDRKKQEQLSTDVAKQIGAIHASPDRMLFILNKIDVFNADGDKADQTRATFIKDITKQLKTIIGKELQEYKTAADHIDPLILSARPALLALRIKDPNSSTEEKIACVKEMDQQFHSILSDDDWDNFPRNATKFTDEQFQNIADSYLKVSHYQIFEDKLTSHIRDHLPALILDEAQGNALTAYTNFYTSINSILSSADDNMDELTQKSNQLKEVSQLIRSQSDSALQDLDKIQESLKTEDENAVRGVCRSLLKSLGADLNILTPLYSSSNDYIRQPYEFITQTFGETVLGSSAYDLADSSKARADLDEDNHYFDAASRLYPDYYVSLVALKNAGYGKIYGKGGPILKDDGADNVVKAFKTYADKLQSIIPVIISSGMTNLGKRVQDVLRVYISLIIQNLSAKIDEKYKDQTEDFKGLRSALDGIKIEDFPEFHAPEFSLTPKFQSFDEETHEEEHESTAYKWTFGLFGHVDYQTVIDQEAYTEFPAFFKWAGDMYNASGMEAQLTAALSDYLATVVTELRETLNNRFAEVIENYNNTIEQKINDLKENLSFNEETLEKARSSEKELSDLANDEKTYYQATVTK